MSKSVRALIQIQPTPSWMSAWGFAVKVYQSAGTWFPRRVFAEVLSLIRLAFKFFLSACFINSWSIWSSASGQSAGLRRRLKMQHCMPLSSSISVALLETFCIILQSQNPKAKWPKDWRDEARRWLPKTPCLTKAARSKQHRNHAKSRCGGHLGHL